MAYLKQPKSDEEVKRLTLSGLKKAYLELSKDYMRLLDGDYVYCGKCNSFLSRDIFYSSNEYASGLFPICKRCLLDMVEQRDKKTGKSNESKETVKRVLQFMNLPYIDDLYESACKTVADEVNERNRKAPFLAYLVPLKSLPQYRNKTWADSEFELGTVTEEEETKIIAKTIKAGKKRFGGSYSNEELMFLENEYQDWITRYECNQKAQEEVFENLSIIKLLKKKALKEGKPTKDLDKQHQDWLDTGNLKPKQNTMDTLSDAQTFGTLIQKYEETRPLPDIDPELQDVDKIGLYIDVFFKGHASKMLGLKNNFTHIYEKFMNKFTVTKPQYDDEEDSEDIFNRVFGSLDEDM
jgi:hypothetical protein